jgi:DNA-binding MarR family transcriptional regulator
MTKKEIDDALRAMVNESTRSWGRMSYQVKKAFDEWAMKELAQQGYPDFKMAYMPLLMNIGVDGNTNKDIAAKSKVTKQAMSKVVKELQDLGLIEVSQHSIDKRSVMIFLTDKGKKMVYTAKIHVKALTNEYKKIIGEKNYEIMIDSLAKIIAYHDNTCGK